jgi:hypothetical protein
MPGPRGYDAASIGLHEAGMALERVIIRKCRQAVDQGNVRLMTGIAVRV